MALTALLVTGGLRATQNAIADGETRSLNLYHLHTHEHLVITYKRNGRYIPAALRKLDWELRDWRKGKAIEMDPRIYDLLWEVYRAVGATTQPIDIVCGYRAPGTNAMLRHRSTRSGVAENSQHMLGHAVDFFIPGVPLEKLREAGLRLQRGGVGYYPRSGSPFVHMDVGNVRMWPRMSRAQLARIFPDGRTAYIPSDGKPLSGYQLAAADIKAHGYAVHKRFDFENMPKPEMVSDGGRPVLVARTTQQPATAAPPPATVPLPTAPVALAAAVPLPVMRPAALVQLAAADTSTAPSSDGNASAPAVTPPSPATLARRQLAAGLAALERHLPPPGDDERMDPAITGSITAFANTDSDLGQWRRGPRPETATEPGASSSALATRPTTPTGRRGAAAPRKATVIGRRIERAFADRVIAALAHLSPPRTPLITRPLDTAVFGYLTSPQRLRDDTNRGLTHPEQIKIASLLETPVRVIAGGFSQAPPIAVWNDYFNGAGVAIVPTRSFGGDVSASTALLDHHRG